MAAATPVLRIYETVHDNGPPTFPSSQHVFGRCVASPVIGRLTAFRLVGDSGSTGIHSQNGDIVRTSPAFDSSKQVHCPPGFVWPAANTNALEDNETSSAHQLLLGGILSFMVFFGGSAGLAFRKVHKWQHTSLPLPRLVRHSTRFSSSIEPMSDAIGTLGAPNSPPLPGSATLGCRASPKWDFRRTLSMQPNANDHAYDGRLSSPWSHESGTNWQACHHLSAIAVAGILVDQTLDANEDSHSGGENNEIPLGEPI